MTTNASQTHDHESGHGKDHGHDDGSSDSSGTGHGHGHGVTADADRRWLSIALALISTFLVGEVVVGIVAHSLALLSDAAHMLTDAASIVLALIAMRLSARPARGIFTYGLRRTEILSAQANGLTLLLLSVWLTYEAISKANRSSLNVEGAFQHILTDLYGFIATAVAGLVVLLTGFARADAIASLVVVVLMLRAGTGLVRDAGRIFLEAAPSGVDPDSLGDRLVALPNVNEVHDLHVWQITSGQTALSAHVLVEVGTDCHGLRRDLEQLLADDYSITHTTLQVDHAGPSADPTPADAQLLPLAERHCADTHGPVHREGPHAH